MSDLSTFRTPLFLIGCGNMASAMLGRWLEAGLDPALVAVYRPSGKAVAPGVAVSDQWPRHLAPGTIILLGMKPYQLDDVAASLNPIAGNAAGLISILAGITTERLRQTFPGIGDQLRVMPNTPVALGQGVCGVYADDATGTGFRALAEALLAPLGLVEWIADESGFNLLTAVSGCGPAFLFRFIDAFADAAHDLGMPADQAARLALATVQGAASLAATADVDPGTLADRVASPGGMTREGLNVMDEEGRLNALMRDVVRATRDRGEAMARE